MSDSATGKRSLVVVHIAVVALLTAIVIAALYALMVPARDATRAASAVTLGAGILLGISLIICRFPARPGARRAALTRRHRDMIVRACQTCGDIALGLADLEGRLVFVNRAWVELFDETDESCFIGHTVCDCIRAVNDAARPSAEVLRSGSWQAEFELIRPDASSVYVKASARLLSDNAGSPACLTVTIVDISECHALRKALKTDRNTLAGIVELNPYAISRYDADGHFLSGNKAYADTFGSTPPPEYSIFTDHVLHREGLGDILKAIRRGESVSGNAEVWYNAHEVDPLAPSKTLCLRGAVFPILDENNDVEEIVVMHEDITQVRKAEQALKESESCLRAVFESAQDLIFMKDRDLRYTRVNPAMERGIGLPARKIVGRTAEDVHDSDLAATIRQVDAEVLSGRIVDREIHTPANGKTLTLHTVASPLRDSDGEVIGVCGITRDVTERRRVETALRESEEMYRALVEHATDGIAIVQDGVLMYVNPQAAQVMGRPQDEIIGASVTEFLHPDESATLVDRHNRRLRGEDVPDRYELRIVRPDGEPVHCELNASLVEYRGSAATLTLVRDITDRKQTEQAVRESEEKFRLISEQSLMAILIIQDSQVKYANRAAADLSERTVEEILDMKPDEFLASVHADDRAKATRNTSQRQTGELTNSVHYTLRIITKSGALKWVELYARSIPIYGGRPADMIMLVDVTEQVKSIDELRKLSAAVEQSANIVCIVDTSGIVQYVNPSFCEVTGYSVEEVVGVSIFAFEPITANPTQGRDIFNMLLDGKTWSGRFQCRRKDGSWFWHRATATPILGEDGRPICFLSVGEDMTAELRTQQKLAESDKMTAIGVLAAGVAHEFKNYLAGIVGNATYARDEMGTSPGNDSVRDAIDQIIEISEKANDIAVSLLSYSRAPAEQMQPEDLGRIVRQSLKLLEKEFRVRSVSIETDLDDVSPVHVSPGKIQQLLLNLLINAQHAIESDGVIRISLEQTADAVRLSVSDTGVGIPSENLSRVFDPFFSTKGVWGKDEVAGVGLGLAICRNIAQEHGGTLTVESVPGVGTTFALALPRPASVSPEGSGKDAPGHGSMLTLILFSLSTSVQDHYLAQAKAKRLEFLIANSLPAVTRSLDGADTLVICDARFVGKMELLNMIETCRRENSPYVVINTAVTETFLGEPFEGALACFAGRPSLEELLERIRHRTATSATGSCPT